MQPTTCTSVEIDRAGRCASDRQEDLNSTRFRSASRKSVGVVIRLLCVHPAVASGSYVVTLCDTAERLSHFSRPR